MSITPAQANMMALQFLQEHGPHDMGTINDEGALAAMITFLDLVKTGAVRKIDFGGGHLRFEITKVGERVLSEGYN